jgi:hypothetical protein
MNPSILFRYSDSRLDAESIDQDGKIDINFWNTNGKTQGVVRLDKKEATALANFLLLQVSKAEPIPAISKKK